MCYSDLKLMGKSWSLWTIYFTLETCCFPRESCKGKDGTRKARGWEPVRKESTPAKETSQQAGARKEMSKIWVLIHSLCLRFPKLVPESYRVFSQQRLCQCPSHDMKFPHSALSLYHSLVIYLEIFWSMCQIKCQGASLQLFVSRQDICTLIFTKAEDHQ